MFKTHHIKKYASPTKKRFSLISLLHIEKGYFLASLLISTGIFVTLIMLWASYMALTAKTWIKLHEEMVLCDASRFMQGIIEKDIGYESTKITIRKDIKGYPILECKTIYGNKTITISKEDIRLIKKVKSGNGIGSNALYINGCSVETWNVKRVDSKNIIISFELKKNQTKRLFKQLVHCYNGEVTENA